MTKTIEPGAAAPAVELADLDGRPHRPVPAGAASSGIRRPVLLVFIKDDCPTSRYTLPFIERIEKALSARGRFIYGISQDDRDTTRARAASEGVGFTLLLDGEGFPVSRAYGLTTVPTCVLVGEDGIIRKTLLGFSREGIEEIARDLAGMAGAPALRVFAEGEQVAETRPG